MSQDAQFRSDLADALEDAARDVGPFDAAALVAVGRRRVARRRLTAGGVLVAFVIAMAGGGLLLGRPSQPPVMATPTPAPATASLDVGGHAFSVSVEPRDTVTYAVVEDGQSLVLARSSIAGLGRKASVGHSDIARFRTVVLGLVPDDAVRVALLDDGNAGGFGPVTLAPVPGTGYRAFGVELLDEPTAPADLAVLWWLADGTPLSNLGPGEGLTVPDRDGVEHVVWLLAAERRIGLEGPYGGGSTILPREDETVFLDASHFREDSTTAPTTYEVSIRSVLVIRGAASDVGATFDDEVVDREVLVHPWVDVDATVVLVTAELPPRSGPVPESPWPPGLTGVSWLDSTGERQEWVHR